MIVIKQSITFISQRIARNANCKHCIYSIITRRRSFAEYWKYSVARFNDVHAFGYNSAGSERIWMKFGELPSILFGAGPDRFWARSTQNRERETLWKFCFFCQVNNARLCRFPSAKFHEICTQVVVL